MCFELDRSPHDVEREKVFKGEPGLAEEGEEPGEVIVDILVEVGVKTIDKERDEQE